jgi:ABC-2 type transport system permease protein
MRAVIALALKDLVLLARDRMAMFWVLGFPLLFGAFLSAVMHATVVPTATSFSIAVVDHSGADQGAFWVARLERQPGVTAAAATAGEAARHVRLGTHLAMLTLPPGYRKGDPSSPIPQIAVDPSRRGELILVRSTVERVDAELSGLVPPPPRSEIVPIARGEASPSGWSLVLSAALLWSMMGCSATFAIAMVAERTRGTLTRLRAAPLTIERVVASKALSSFIACIIVTALLVTFAHALLDVSVSEPAALAIAIVSASVCFVGMTLLLGAMGRSEQAVAGSGWGVLVLMAMLGGAMVPVAFMPEWLRTAGVVSPARWAIVALEGAIWRGFDVAEMAAPCAMMLLLGALCLGLGARRMKAA